MVDAEITFVVYDKIRKKLLLVIQKTDYTNNFSEVDWDERVVQETKVGWVS